MSDNLIVRAVVVRRGRVLLLQRAAQDTYGGHWELPGGPCLPDEEPRDAVRRHLADDAGLPVEQLDDLLYVESFRGPEGSLRERLFVAQAASGAVTLGQQHSAFSWFVLPGPLPAQISPTAHLAMASLTDRDWLQAERT